MKILLFGFMLYNQNSIQKNGYKNLQKKELKKIELQLQHNELEMIDEKYYSGGFDERFPIIENTTAENKYKWMEQIEKKKWLDLLQDNNISIYQKLLFLNYCGLVNINHNHDFIKSSITADGEHLEQLFDDFLTKF